MKQLPYLLCVSLLIFLLLPLPSYSQSNVKEHLSLTGEVNLIRVFVESNGESWDPEEMEYYDALLDSGLNWVKDEASFYGKSVEFTRSKFTGLYDRIELEEARLGATRGIRGKVAKELGFDSMAALLEAYQMDLQKDKVKLMLFVRSQSRSHARNYFSVGKLDVAIVYSGMFGFQTSKYVVAHELLHLFGAWDLYQGEWQNEEKAKIAKEKYPYSVMIQTKGSKEEMELLEVDELTAWRVGWAPYDEEFMTLKPERVLNPTYSGSKKKGKEIKFELGKKNKN